MDELLARHRREVKELTGKITALKKSVSKGASDKSKKKQVQEQITALETELADQHKREIEEFKASADASTNKPESTETENTQKDHTDEKISAKPTPESISNDMQNMNLDSNDKQAEFKPKQSRQARRKDRKNAQMEQMRKEAEAEAALAPNLREIERADIDQLATSMNLVVREIAADGHCLYNALVDQLCLHEPDQELSYKNLREIAANHMRSHADDFMPFLANEIGDSFTKEEFDDYCNKLQHEAVWGGQIEIQAISQALRRPIHVVQRASATIKIGHEFEPAKPLIVSYHRHAYGLGEHYNSLIPK